jgi:hypothetical protein
MKFAKSLHMTLGDDRSGPCVLNETKSVRAGRAGGSKVTVCVAQSFSSMRLSLIGRCSVTGKAVGA